MQGVRLPTVIREKEEQPIHRRRKNSQDAPKHTTLQGVRLPAANCGGAERR